MQQQQSRNRRRPAAFRAANWLLETSMARSLTFAVAALLLATPGVHFAVAQTTTPTAAPTAAPITETDRQFLIQDAQGSAYEIAIAALAQKRSSNDNVKAYASRIVTDHATYNQALQELAQAKGLTLPTTMTADDQVRLNSINSQSGSTADRSFIEEAVRVNAEDKQTAAKEAASTADPDIKAFLRKFEAMDREHEQMALALRR